MQSLYAVRRSATWSPSPPPMQRHTLALICGNLYPTCSRLSTNGRRWVQWSRSVFGDNLKGYLCPNIQLTAFKKRKDAFNQRGKNGNCRAALPDDAPFALAIGASILSTLVFPAVPESEENNGNSIFGPDDVRSGAMQIISFIPLFNWLVWVFAWLDTRQPRYLAFAAIYLAPYLKTGLSLSPEYSWLPIISVLAGVLHLQLDISISAEGAQSPLGVMSEKTQIKDLGVQARHLYVQLKELAEKSDAQSFENAIQEDDQLCKHDLEAIDKERLKKEFAEFDAKLSRSKAIEEPAKEIDS